MVSLGPVVSCLLLSGLFCPFLSCLCCKGTFCLIFPWLSFVVLSCLFLRTLTTKTRQTTCNSVPDYQGHQGVLSSVLCIFPILLSLVLIHLLFIPSCLCCIGMSYFAHDTVVLSSVLSHLVLSRLVLAHTVILLLFVFALHSYGDILSLFDSRVVTGPARCPSGHPWSVLMCLCCPVSSLCPCVLLTFVLINQSDPVLTRPPSQSLSVCRRSLSCF